MKKKLFSIVISIFLVSSNVVAGTIFDAIKKDDFKNVARLVKKNRRNANRVNKRKETPLWLACRRNDEKMVELLLSHGADASVNKANKIGITPLSWAYYYQNLKIAKLLIAYGSKSCFNKYYILGKSSFYHASSENNSINYIHVFVFLVRHNTTITDKDIREVNHNEEMVKCLRFVMDFEKENTYTDKMKFIEGNKKNKYIKYIVERVFFRSMNELLDKKKSKINETLIYNIVKNKKLKESLQKYLFLNPKNQLKKYGPYGYIAKLIRVHKLCFTKRNLKKLTHLVKDKLIRNSDFHDRIAYVVRKV